MSLLVDNLTFSYGSARVLGGVSLRAGAGELVCVLGGNGAGKTTLFRCILGLLRGYGGRIELSGADAARLTPSERARRMAYIPQAQSTALRLSVFQSVLMGTNPRLEPLRTPGAAEQAVVYERLEQLGISHLAGRCCAELSGGERQLVLIARALAQNAALLLMDEPTAHLDYGNRLRLLEQVRALARQGYLILLSTHDPAHALHFADRAVVLHGGQVARDGPPAAVLTPALIEEVYGVRTALCPVETPHGPTSVLIPLP